LLSSVTAALVQARDGIRVTSGALRFASHVGHIDIAGRSDFSMQADVDSTGGIYSLDDCAADPEFCAPGSEVSVFAHWTGLDVRGSATLRGQEFVIGSESADAGGAIVNFDGSVTMPPFTDSGTAEVTAPFTFGGQLTPPGAVESEALSGAGTVTIELTKSAFVDGWIVTSATYAFEKKPVTP
jgi:hypothetical protein